MRGGGGGRFPPPPPLGVRIGAPPAPRLGPAFRLSAPRCAPRCPLRQQPPSVPHSSAKEVRSFMETCGAVGVECWTGFKSAMPAVAGPWASARPVPYTTIGGMGHRRNIVSDSASYGHGSATPGCWGRSYAALGDNTAGSITRKACPCSPVQVRAQVECVMFGGLGREKTLREQRGRAYSVQVVVVVHSASMSQRHTPALPDIHSHLRQKPEQPHTSTRANSTQPPTRRNAGPANGALGRDETDVRMDRHQQRTNNQHSQ